MTSNQYKATRERLGMTQAQLAAKLGVTVLTVKRRERDGAKIGREAEIAIKALTKQTL